MGDDIEYLIIENLPRSVHYIIKRIDFRNRRSSAIIQVMNYYDLHAPYLSGFRDYLDDAKKEKLDQFFDLLVSRALERGFIGEAPVELLWQRHILDSIIILQKPEVIQLFKDFKSVVDLGSGAGLPGIPLAIIFPEVKFYLVESMQKRCAFLQEVKNLLSLENIVVVNKRSEDLVQKEVDDLSHLILFRAFLKPLVSLELALHIITENSKVLYWRSRRFDIPERPEDDVGSLQEQIRSRLRQLGYRINAFFKLDCPDDLNLRGIYIIDFTGKPGERYPRRWASIKNDPLCNKVV